MIFWRKSKLVKQKKKSLPFWLMILQSKQRWSHGRSVLIFCTPDEWKDLLIFRKWTAGVTTGAIFCVYIFTVKPLFVCLFVSVHELHIVNCFYIPKSWSPCEKGFKFKIVERLTPSVVAKSRLCCRILKFHLALAWKNQYFVIKSCCLFMKKLTWLDPDSKLWIVDNHCLTWPGSVLDADKLTWRTDSKLSKDSVDVIGGGSALETLHWGVSALKESALRTPHWPPSALGNNAL